MDEFILHGPARFPDSIEEMTPAEAFISGYEWGSFRKLLSNADAQEEFTVEVHAASLKTILKEIMVFKERHPDIRVYPVVNKSETEGKFVMKICRRPPLKAVANEEIEDGEVRDGEKYRSPNNGKGDRSG